MNTDPDKCRLQIANCRLQSGSWSILQSAICNLQFAICFLFLIWAPRTVGAQQPTVAPWDTIPAKLTAGEAEGDPPRRNLVPFLNWNWGFTTFHIGLATGFDIAWFAQDDDSKEDPKTHDEVPPEKTEGT